MNVDFHIHTNRSDGLFSPQEVIDQARSVGIRALAITDHDHTFDLTTLRENNRDISLVQGCEFSCSYICGNGSAKQVHVVGLDFDPKNAQIQAILNQNQDRRMYIDPILEKLRYHGIDIGTYDDLCRKFPESCHIGRRHIARVMVDAGYAKSVSQAYADFLGAFGKKLAYIENPLKYPSLEKVVRAIKGAGGVPVLCHLLYYRFPDEEARRLAACFGQLAGAGAAMEVFYQKYTPEERHYLMDICIAEGLWPSAASDFHGFTEDHIKGQFPADICPDLVRRLITC